MPQNAYPFDMNLGFVGGRADADSYSAQAYVAAGPLSFGVAVVAALTVASGGLVGARLPGIGSGTITLSTDLIAANSVAGTVAVTSPAGVTTTTALTATVYATSHALTWAAVAAKIAALAGVASAVAALDVITVTASPDYSVALSGFAVTLGASQPTVVIAQTNTDRFLGFAMKTEREPVNGVASFAAGDVLAVMTDGRLLETSEQAVTYGDPVYVRFMAGAGGSTPGALRKDSDSGTAFLVTRARWLKTAAAGAIADLEINLP